MADNTVRAKAPLAGRTGLADGDLTFVSNKLGSFSRMLSDRLTFDVTACCRGAGLPVDTVEVLPSQRSELGHFQINAALALAKVLGRAPRAIAQEIVVALGDVPYLTNIRVDGPGFVNITLRPDFLAARLAEVAGDERQGVPLPATPPGTVVLDFGGPNVAKAMHVGHLRSAIIGDTLSRIARFLGYSVIADVHLGDWGLPMGMVLGELFDREPGLAGADPLWIAADWAGPSIDELNEIYPAAAAKCRVDEALMARARLLTADLQGGRPLLVAMWKKIVATSIDATRADFGRLNVEFDVWFGESRAHDRLMALIDTVRSSGEAELSDGALVIRVPDASDREDIPPLILEKSEGGVLYAGTDLATIADRVDTFAPDVILYVVDQRQHIHLEQVFRAAGRLGFVRNGKPHLEHIGFGTINGMDGKPLKTRAGGVLRLSDLIDQAYGIARARFSESSSFGDVPTSEIDKAAECIAIASIRFADLSNNRRSDYVFNIAHFSALEGRTGPYLCYVYSRASAILRKGAALGLRSGEIGDLATDVEQVLALRLLVFPDAVAGTFAKRLPNILCEHLFALSQTYNAFYHQVPVLTEADEARRASLLALTAAVAAQIKLGVGLLGIEQPAFM